MFNAHDWKFVLWRFSLAVNRQPLSPHFPFGKAGKAPFPRPFIQYTPRWSAFKCLMTRLHYSISSEFPFGPARVISWIQLSKLSRVMAKSAWVLEGVRRKVSIDKEGNYAAQILESACDTMSDNYIGKHKTQNAKHSHSSRSTAFGAGSGPNQLIDVEIRQKSLAQTASQMALQWFLYPRYL